LCFAHIPAGGSIATCVEVCPQGYEEVG
jgi:hypothetical protein